jgi:hypothetical protein
MHDHGFQQLQITISLIATKKRRMDGAKLR